MNSRFEKSSTGEKPISRIPLDGGDLFSQYLDFVSRIQAEVRTARNGRLTTESFERYWVRRLKFEEFEQLMTSQEPQIARDREKMLRCLNLGYERWRQNVRERMDCLLAKASQKNSQ